jgi:hypothetical protein
MSGVCVTGSIPWVNLLTLAVVIGAICTVFNRVFTEFLRLPGRHAEQQRLPTKRKIS